MAEGRIEAQDIFSPDILIKAGEIHDAISGILDLLKGEAGKLKMEVNTSNGISQLTELSAKIDSISEAYKNAAKFETAHETAINELTAAMKAHTAAEESARKAAEVRAKALAEERKEAQAYRNEIKSLGLSVSQFNKLTASQQQSVLQLGKSIQTYTTDIKTNEQAVLSLLGSLNMEKMTYNEMGAVYATLKDSLKNLTTEELNSNAAAIKMSDTLLKMHDQMDAIQKSTGRYTMSVGNYKQAFDGLGFSIRQVVRETPSLGIGLNQFFLAISNNIPMVIDAWKSYSDTVKETNAKIEAGIIQGQKMEATWKHALRSVLSWQTAVIAVLTILSNSKMMESIGNWFKDILGIADKLVVKVKTIGEEMGSIFRGGVTENDLVRAELHILSDYLKRHPEDKTNVIKRVNELTNANLSLSTSYDDLTKAIEKYEKKQEQIGRNKTIVDFAAQNRNSARLIEKANAAKSLESVFALAGKEIRDESGKLTEEFEKAQKIWDKHAVLRNEKRKAELEKELQDLEEQERKWLNYQKTAPTSFPGIATLSALQLQIRNKRSQLDDTDWNNLLSNLFSPASLGIGEVLYKPETQNEKKERSRRAKEEKADYMDLWKEMMQSRYKLVSEEYLRERRQEEDAYQLEVTNNRELYADKKKELYNFYRVQMGLAEDNPTWKKQVEQNESFLKDLAELSKQYQTIRASEAEEYYRTMGKLNSDYVKNIMDEYENDVKAFEAAESEKVTIARRHISRRNKTIADNFNRNESIMRAAAASQEKMEALREQRNTANDAINKEKSRISAMLNEAYTPIKEELDKLEEQYKKDIEKYGQDHAITSITAARMLAVREQMTATIDMYTKMSDETDKRREEIDKNIEEGIQKEAENFASIVSEIDLTKEFKRKGYDQQIVEVIFGLTNERGQEKYILEYYTRMAEKVAEATGQRLSDVMEAYAKQLNAKYGTNVSVGSDGKFMAGGGDGEKFSALWGDWFNDKFWDDFSTYKDALVDMADATWEYVSDMIDAWVELAEAKAEAAAEETDNAREEYERQKSLMDAGYANSMETAWREYQEKKELQEQAEREYKDRQLAQQRIDTAMQVSSLITAIAKLFESSSSMGAFGIPIAIAASVAMLAAFAAQKSAASQAAKYGDGDVQVVGGGTHASGNDTLLGYSMEGREMRVERGEVVGIIPARNVKKYGQSNVVSLLTGLKNGTFERLQGDVVQRNYNLGIMPAEGANGVNLGMIENSLASIDGKIGRQTYTEADGTVVEVNGYNIIRRRIAS